MSILGYIKNGIKRYFLSGILVIVPLIITYVVLRFFLSAIDGILSPLLVRYLGYDIPGLGIVITIIIVFVAGILTRGVLGSRSCKSLGAFSQFVAVGAHDLFGSQATADFGRRAEGEHVSARGHHSLSASWHVQSCFCRQRSHT